MKLTIERGRHDRIGATFDGDGVNFALFSEHATSVELCLFSPDGMRETHRLKLPERTGSLTMRREKSSARLRRRRV